MYLQTVVISILTLQISVSLTINPNCNFFQKLEIGRVYNIFNPEFPRYYQGSTSCLWVLTSPVGSKIVLTCDDMEIPFSKDCQEDHLSVSLTGERNLKNGQKYCGRSKKQIISKNNALAVGLFSSSNTSVGRVSCTLTALTASSCDCGWKHEPRIVGGHETGVNEFPSMAAIIDKHTASSFCGASIISERYSLSAAHCLIDRAAPDLGLLVGDHDISTGKDTNATALYRVSKLVLHSQYDEATQYNDIAIVKTANPIVFSLLVGPICLPFKYTYSNFTAQTVTALGWGLTEFSGQKAYRLQAVDLSVVSNSFCSSEIPNAITDQQICTYATGKDSCSSDSGGPLLWQDAKTRKLQLVGVISSGVGCATTKPTVNTRMTSYLTWIVSETRDAVYCIK